jgi:uncharacterized protein YdeI (YjbR/CyaY-like superfamily)
MRPIDEEKYRQYFSKRRPNSHWSRVNKEKVKHLIQQGLMEEAGYGSIEIAKANGSWYFLDEVEALVVPDDLATELSRRPGAREYFADLNKSAKKQLLFWVKSAKRPATRKKRIIEIAKNAEQERKPKQFG